MCGRFSLAAPAEELVETFDVPALGFAYRPRYNITPGQDTVVVAEDRRGRRMGQLRWGFVPGWADKAGRGFINARGESVGDNPSFRDAFSSRRCLVVADGFYEWRPTDGEKQPHWFHSADGGLLALGGIWERWQAAGSEPLHTFAVITVGASADVADVHHRMPLLLPPEWWDEWLGHDTSVARLYEAVGPAPVGTVVGHPVSRAVNDPARDGPDLVRPLP